jgi:hypothetical protein
MTGGFFAILDDIAMLMDDAAAVTKVAVNKTVPILGDDLAVGAQKSSTFKPSRELPVLWEITKGSFKNKLIILPIVFLLSSFFPWLITYVLIAGGIYLAYEGAEKIVEVFHHYTAKQKEHKTIKQIQTEEQKIKSAILTDFILSIEIIVIALGTVINEPLATRLVAVSSVAVLATVAVYGIVALLVRMDDVGFYLIDHSSKNSLKEKFGKLLVASLPKVIKVLAVVGTIAMLVVAGGIFTHNIHYIHHIYESTFHIIPSIIFDMILGLIIGYIAVLIHGMFSKH